MSTKSAAEAAINKLVHGVSKLLLKVLPLEVMGSNNLIMKTYALLDEGSSTSLVNEKLAFQMGVDQKRSDLTLNWIGSHATNVKSMSCHLRIRVPSVNRK